MEDVKNQIKREIEAIITNIKLSREVTAELERAKELLMKVGREGVNKGTLNVIDSVRKELKQAGSTESKELDLEQNEMILLRSLEESIERLLKGK
jgi:hypothetical protein